MSQGSTELLPLRPHHVLCILHFIGRGYSDLFAENMRRIIHTIRQTQTMVKLVSGTDAICACCPNNLSGVCQKEPSPAVYDSRCLDLFRLRQGQILSWAELEAAARRGVPDNNGLSRVCAGCRWLSLCQSIAY